MQQFILVSLEGNIGSGKSTLLKELMERFKDNQAITFLPEPIDEWNQIRDREGVTILEKYYTNMPKYSFAFQMMAYISRLACLRELTRTFKGRVIIMERSIFTDCHVFAKMLYDEGRMEDIEYAIYLRWFHEFIRDMPPLYNFYIRCEPLVAQKRVAIRSRSGEETISLAYLQNCHDYHEAWLMKGNDTSDRTDPQMVFDGNIDFNEQPLILKDWIRQIEDFLESLVPSEIIK
jgi:deoxyguanosine kinase